MKKYPPTFLAACLGIAVLGGAGCHRDPEVVPQPPPLPTAKVRLAVAIVGTNQATEQVVGTVRARTSALVSAKVSGRIRTLSTAIGQEVKAGELLAELDAAEIGARFEQATAALENARRELDRYRTLLTQKAVTQSEFDAVEARQRIAGASASEAETMLGYTRIQAPFAGRIARKLADIGDLAAPGKPLLELESMGGLQFESDVSEALAGRLHLGETLSVTVASIGHPLPGRIVEIAPASNPLSRTLKTKLDLPAAPGLRAGQFGRLAIPLRATANVRVPAPAVIQRGQLEIVFVAADGRAELRLVKTGKRLGDAIEILAGLDDGESVITTGHATLREGQPLIVEQPAGEPAK